MMNPDEEDDREWWLNLFLARTFFQGCGLHNRIGNHQNRYCIDCEMAACQHCMAAGTHAGHRVISIYRLVYKDVVSQQQMSFHMDCSRIQPYASNGRQVLALHPLPHYNSGQLNQDRACRTCTRILMNPESYRYCSIACKRRFTPAAENQGDARAGAGSGSGSGAGSGSGSGAGRKGGGATGTPSKRSESGASRRKGVPHRAPLF